MPAGSFVSAIPVAHMFCTEQILYPSWGYNDKVQSNETHAREVKKKKVLYKVNFSHWFDPGK